MRFGKFRKLCHGAPLQLDLGGKSERGSGDGGGLAKCGGRRNLVGVDGLGTAGPRGTECGERRIFVGGAQGPVLDILDTEKRVLEAVVLESEA